MLDFQHDIRRVEHLSRKVPLESEGSNHELLALNSPRPQSNAFEAVLDPVRYAKCVNRMQLFQTDCFLVLSISVKRAFLLFKVLPVQCFDLRV